MKYVKIVGRTRRSRRIRHCSFAVDDTHAYSIACTRQLSGCWSSYMVIMRYHDAPCSSAFNATIRSTSCGSPEILLTGSDLFHSGPSRSQHWRILQTVPWRSQDKSLIAARVRQVIVSSSAPFSFPHMLQGIPSR